MLLKSLVLQIKKVRFREVKQLAQGHAARKISRGSQALLMWRAGNGVGLRREASEIHVSACIMDVKEKKIRGGENQSGT